MEYEGGANSGTSKRDEILEGVPVKVDGEWLIAIDKRDAPRPGDLVRVRTKRGESWTTTIIAILSEQGGRFGERYEPRVIVRGEPKGDREQVDVRGDNLLAIADDLSRMAETLRGIARRK